MPSPASDLENSEHLIFVTHGVHVRLVWHARSSQTCFLFLISYVCKKVKQVHELPELVKVTNFNGFLMMITLLLNFYAN
jgi:hypothetical protein